MRQHLPKWRPLVDLVASLAERSDKLDEALQLYKREISLLDANKDVSAIQELEKRIAAVTARQAAAKPPTANVAAESDAASKVRALMNVPATVAQGQRRPRIGMVGPPPAPGVLPEGFPVTVLRNDIVAEEESDSFLVDFTGHLSQAVRIVFPDVEFVYSQIKSENGTMSDAAILQAMGPLLESKNAVDIVLHPYGAPMRDPIPPTLVKNIAKRKILCVLAAGNEGFDKDSAGKSFADNSPFRPGGELRKYVAVAAAVDPTGKAARFSQRDTEVVWAPGTEVSEWQGTSLAAALTAGAAAWLKAQKPDLRPEEIVRVLQETSIARTDPEIKVIDVSAALAKVRASGP